MFKLIKTCNGLYLITSNYENSSYYFYETINNMGIVEVTCYETETLEKTCRYLYEQLEAYKKVLPNKYEHKKYCFKVYDIDDASFCLLADSIEEVNYNLQFFDDIYDLINSFPFSFQYN